MSSRSVGTEERLAISLAAIHHRGPDDLGIEWLNDTVTQSAVGLGLTRLAILDLTPSGHQPMWSADRRYTISFNGEITNYLELRQELTNLGRNFLSDSDTEVLLQCFEVWGKSALNKIEGMYALALFDAEKQSLLLARDVFGIKPLFYAFKPGQQLVFSSEVQGLLPLLGHAPKLNWQTAVSFIEWGAYDSTEQTFIEGVLQLMPGHFVEFDLSKRRLSEPERYWWPSVETTSPDSLEQAVDTVRALFLESVSHNLRSDVPVGVALSGGIDSSAITSAIRHLDKGFELQTFSFISSDAAQSEAKWIDLVVKRTKSIPHSIHASSHDLERDLDSLITAQGEPFGSTSVYAQYRVFQRAREEGVVVTLDGQGADELFVGYSGYPSKRLHTLIETGRWATASRYLSHWSEWPGRSSTQAVLETGAQFLPAAFSRFYLGRKGNTPVLNNKLIRERGIDSGFPGYQVERAFGNRLKTHLRSELTSLKLPALLRHGDRNSMKFSVESRVPFLSRQLTEYVLSLPEDYLAGDDGSSKSLLRKALRGIVPQEILDRRDKIGFSTPEADWLVGIDWHQELSGLNRDSFILGNETTQIVLASGDSNLLKLDSGGRWRVLNLLRWARLMGISISG